MDTVAIVNVKTSVTPSMSEAAPPAAPAATRIAEHHIGAEYHRDEVADLDGDDDDRELSDDDIENDDDLDDVESLSSSDISMSPSPKPEFTSQDGPSFTVPPTTAALTSSSASIERPPPATSKVDGVYRCNYSWIDDKNELIRVCEFTTRSSSTVRRHKFFHDRRQSEHARFRCSLCDGGSNNAGVCHSHIKLCHSRLQEELVSRGEPIGHIVDTQSSQQQPIALPPSLPRPVQDSDGIFHCHHNFTLTVGGETKDWQCEYFSKESAGLKRHRNIHEQQHKRFSCSLCGAQSDGASSINDHVRRCHQRLNEELAAKGEALGRTVDTRELVLPNPTRKRDRSSAGSNTSIGAIKSSRDSDSSLSLSQLHPNAHHLNSVSQSNTAATVDVKSQLLQSLYDNKNNVELSSAILSRPSLPPSNTNLLDPSTGATSRKRVRDRESAADSGRRRSPMPALESVNHTVNHTQPQVNSSIPPLLPSPLPAPHTLDNARPPYASAAPASQFQFPILAPSFLPVYNGAHHESRLQPVNVDTEDEDSHLSTDSMPELQLQPLPAPPLPAPNANVDEQSAAPTSAATPRSQSSDSVSERCQQLERLITVLNERHQADQQRIEQLSAVIELLVRR